MLPTLKKYFIALVPPEPLQSEIQQVKQRMYEQYGSKGALRSPAHLTLHMPFGFRESEEPRLIEQLASFAPPVKSPTLILHNFSTFAPRVIFIDVLKNEDLRLLQQELVLHVKRTLGIFNQADDRRGFHPHFTVAFRDLKKPAFHAAWAVYEQQPFDARFNCSAFHLLKHGDERWDVIHEFKL